MNPKLLALIVTHTKALSQVASLIGGISRIQLSSCAKCSTCNKVATFRKESQLYCDRCESERRVKGEINSEELEAAEDIRLLESYVESLDIAEGFNKLQS